MAKTRRYWLSCFNKLLSFMLIALGFTACDENNRMDMYGMPPAKYSIKANVLNEADQPIKGIKVDVKNEEGDNYISESGLTDAKGIYEARIYHEKINVVFTDIDGDSYKKDSIQVDLSKEENPNYEFIIKLKEKE